MAEVAWLSAEEATCAALLLDSFHEGETWRYVNKQCKPQDFFYKHLSLIEEAAAACYDDESVSVPRVCWQLEQWGDLDKVEWRGLKGEEFIVDLVARWALSREVCTPAGVYWSARMVHEMAERRRGHVRAQKAAQDALRPSEWLSDDRYRVDL